MKSPLLFRLFVFLAIVTGITISGASPHKELWHTPPEKWTQPRIFHSAFDGDFENRIVITQNPLIHADVDEKNFSPNKAYWFAVSTPDFRKEGPWATLIQIFNERDYSIRIEIRDHNNWEIKPKWVNEKLLYIEVWWGRIVGSYFLFNVESEMIIAKEMIHDGQMAFQQFQEAEKMKEGCPDNSGGC